VSGTMHIKKSKTDHHHHLACAQCALWDTMDFITGGH